MAQQILAQIIVAAIQAIIQGISARLSEEERVLLVVDPTELETDEERRALELLIKRAKLHRHWGRQELTKLREKVASGLEDVLVLNARDLETDEEKEAVECVRGRGRLMQLFRPDEGVA